MKLLLVVLEVGSVLLFLQADAKRFNLDGRKKENTENQFISNAPASQKLDGCGNCATDLNPNQIIAKSSTYANLITRSLLKVGNYHNQEYENDDEDDENEADGNNNENDENENNEDDDENNQDNEENGDNENNDEDVGNNEEDGNGEDHGNDEANNENNKEGENNDDEDEDESYKGISQRSGVSGSSSHRAQSSSEVRHQP